MSTGSWIFSILGTLIILGLIVGLIIWAVSSRRDRGSSATGEPAREILDRRLASGELNTEQYEQLTQTLADSGTSTNGPRPTHPASATG